MAEPGSRGVKRKRVSVTNKTQEVSDPKRKRVLLSANLKTRTYHFWYDSMIDIAVKFGKTEADIKTCVDLSCQIQSILYSAHSHCRKVGNGTNTDAQIEGKSASFMYAGQGYSKPLLDICTILRNNANRHALIYKKYTSNTDDNWISVAAALFSFLQNFKNRLKEVRVGNSKIQVGKADNEVSYVNASDYGIEQAHQNLLEGASFPPHVKSSTCQSLGPATLMVMVMEKGQEAKYGDKWREALSQCLGPLHDKEVFIKTIAELGPAQSKALVQLVCDIILLSTTKQIHRAYYAPCFMMNALSKEADEDEPMGEDPAQVEVFDETMPDNLNNTGRGLFATYHNKVCKKSYSMNTNLTSEQAAQLCFHAMFGTYVDNLNLLEAITDVAQWDTRNEFGDKIKGLGVNAPKKTFRMPKFKYWAKMATAMQTSILGGQVQDLLPNSVFSGPTHIKWNKYLNDYYTARLTSSISYVKPANPAALRDKLMVVLQTLVSQIQNCGGLSRGATCWHKVGETIEYKNAPDGRDPDIDPGVSFELSIKTFLGGEQDDKL